jgi:hypothetical protein
MAFYLARERDEDVAGAYVRYQEYLRQHQDRFPPGGYALATAEWYQDPNDHRSPHDGWLNRITISEPASGDRQEERITSIRVELLGAYHDGIVVFNYSRVFRYSLRDVRSIHGHQGWRYDEFRVSDDGFLLHEIEWSNGANWLIEASDVEFLWIPR